MTFNEFNAGAMAESVEVMGEDFVLHLMPDKSLRGVFNRLEFDPSLEIGGYDTKSLFQVIVANVSLPTIPLGTTLTRTEVVNPTSDKGGIDYKVVRVDVDVTQVKLYVTDLNR